MSQATLAQAPMRAAAPAAPVGQVDVAGPTDGLGPSRSTGEAPVQPSIEKSPLNPDLALRLADHAMETAWAAGQLMGMGLPGMTMMPLPVPPVPTLRVNQQSGVFASETQGFGSSTKFSLPGGAEIWKFSTPGYPGQGEGTNEMVVGHQKQPFNSNRMPLAANGNPDGTLQVTNLDGTLTILNPDDLTLQHRPAADDRPQ